ncbi:MAG: YEATS-associated helix-containing protein [Chitinophagaceae bacterium]
MSLTFLLTIMLVSGIAGGCINFLLPSNITADGKKIRKLLACLILGVGATILVPLFLEIAQSKLMDNIHYGWQLQTSECDCSIPKTDTIVVQITKVDTARKAGDTSKAALSDTVTRKTGKESNNSATNCCVPIKNYFLFAGYCLIAAAAGLRFINGLIDGVLKDKEIADKNKIINKTKEELEIEKKAAEASKKAEEEANTAKEKAEKQKDKLAAQDKKKAETEEEALQLELPARFTIFAEQNLDGNTVVIGPVTNENDRQKGRFGGAPQNNGRKISATVTNNRIDGIYYPFTLTVESLDPAGNPLGDEVIFFLHDSFTPSFVRIMPVNGKAEYKNSAYGAFTVGAVTDEGKTLLELDLSEDVRFPKEFRER